MYVVTVLFELNSDVKEQFLPFMVENARRSLAEETGCQVFDVCTDPNNHRAIFLYEVYDDRAAFETHLASQNFRSFDQATASMIATKKVRLFSRMNGSSPK
jgi:(4S)-4-hydroxy-5-phosphonooxypentane-2,3-dione isomerase